MCTVAPFLLPGLACVAPRGAPVLHGRSTVATYAEGAPAAMRGYGYDDDGAADIDVLLRGVHAAVRPRTPAGHTPQPVAAGADLPMSSAEFLALSQPRPDNNADFDLEAVLRGIRSIRIPAAGFAPVHEVSVVATPTTPVANFPAPLSYGDDAAEDADSPATTIQTSPKKQQAPAGQTYDADIDATFRAMEKDPAERPSVLYLWTVQAEGIAMARRAHVVAWMYNLSGYHGLAPGTLHRAVSYVDRFLSVRRIDCGSAQLFLLGAVAVFTASKYEDRRTTLALNADVIASHVVGCTRREVVHAERVLFAALGYRLSGPTTYTFVDHFTRHSQECADGSKLRTLAHHLADMALLDYWCIRFLPSAVAASAIALAKLAMNPAASWSEEIKVTGYTLQDLAGCMDAIKEMHGLGLQDEWPGCAQMIEDCMLRYSLPPR